MQNYFVYILQPEGAVGYAHWVCKTLLDRSIRNTEFFRYSIQHLAAVPAASDAMAKYTGMFLATIVYYMQKIIL